MPAASSLSDFKSIRLALHIIILHHADNDNTPLYKSEQIQTTSPVYYKQFSMSLSYLQVPICIFLMRFFSPACNEQHCAFRLNGCLS